MIDARKQNIFLPYSLSQWLQGAITMLTGPFLNFLSTTPLDGRTIDTLSVTLLPKAFGTQEPCSFIAPSRNLREILRGNDER